jgi:S-adenosylmethionine decarboxylase
MPLGHALAPDQNSDVDATGYPVGLEWIIDAIGCAPALLASPGVMRGICDSIIAEAELHVVGEPVWHQFDAPGGVTGLYLLSESHLTCHTFPEVGAATFNLYCCRRRQRLDWSTLLHEQLRATNVSCREFARGPAVGEKP